MLLSSSARKKLNDVNEMQLKKTSEMIAVYKERKEFLERFEKGLVTSKELQEAESLFLSFLTTYIGIAASTTGIVMDVLLSE